MKYLSQPVEFSSLQKRHGSLDGLFFIRQFKRSPLCISSATPIASITFSPRRLCGRRSIRSRYSFRHREPARHVTDRPIHFRVSSRYEKRKSNTDDIDERDKMGQRHEPKHERSLSFIRILLPTLLFTPVPISPGGKACLFSVVSYLAIGSHFATFLPLPSSYVPMLAEPLFVSGMIIRLPYPRNLIA